MVCSLEGRDSDCDCMACQLRRYRLQVEQLLNVLQSVRQMRKIQRNYFRRRTPAALDLAKEAERNVDRFLEIYLPEKTVLWDGE